MSIIEALEFAIREFLVLPGIHGISRRGNTIVIYCEQGASVPISIMGYPVEIVYTSRLGAF